MFRTSLRLLACLICSLAMQLHAATAADIQGEWVADGPATWELMKLAPQIAGMPVEQQKIFETMIITQSGNMKFTVTADKIIHTQGTEAKEETYKVTSIEGDKVTTETTDAAGKVDKTEITVAANTLTLASLTQVGMKMVLKRSVAK